MGPDNGWCGTCGREGPAPSEQIKTVDEVVRDHVLHVLQQLHGNKSRTAKALGLHRRALYRLLDRWKRADFDPFAN
jgi:ActR/RegA family two-component response regulator